MAPKAASQGDAARKTAHRQADESKLREEAPKSPSPAKDVEETDDVFAPIFTQLMEFVKIVDWCEEK